MEKSSVKEGQTKTQNTKKSESFKTLILIAVMSSFTVVVISLLTKHFCFRCKKFRVEKHKTLNKFEAPSGKIFYIVFW